MIIPKEIQRMSKRRKEEWIVAIDKLISLYKTNNSYSCPLCIASECSDCVWKIFEGLGCLEYATGKGFSGVPAPYNYGWKRWKRIRYPMLRKWRRIIFASFDKENYRKADNRSKK